MPLVGLVSILSLSDMLRLLKLWVACGCLCFFPAGSISYVPGDVQLWGFYEWKLLKDFWLSMYYSGVFPFSTDVLF